MKTSMLQIKILSNNNDSSDLDSTVGEKLEELHDTLITFSDVTKTFVKSYSKKGIDEKKKLKLKKTLNQWLNDIKQDIDDI